MEFISSIYTDAGIVKEVNQDAAIVHKAHSSKGDIFFGVVCDGMGGLSQGEIASATVLNHMSNWFQQTFPELLFSDFSLTKLKKSLKQEINRVSHFLDQHGRQEHIQLGTTLVLLLIVNDTYYICNVGDSRAYGITEQVTLLTHDQSYVQNEMDMGRMTLEDAENSPQRSVLLQCIGAIKDVEPDFYVGQCQSGTNFLLCSDGFRHVITEDEMFDCLNPHIAMNKNFIDNQLRELTELIKMRREEDNITSVLVHVM